MLSQFGRRRRRWTVGTTEDAQSDTVKVEGENGADSEGDVPKFPNTVEGVKVERQQVFKFLMKSRKENFYLKILTNIKKIYVPKNETCREMLSIVVEAQAQIFQ